MPSSGYFPFLHIHYITKTKELKSVNALSGLLPFSTDVTQNTPTDVLSVNALFGQIPFSTY